MIMLPLFGDLPESAMTSQSIGSKAYQLYRLQLVGFPVPKSWIILTKAYTLHLEQSQTKHLVTQYANTRDCGLLSEIQVSIETTPLSAEVEQSLEELYVSSSQSGVKEFAIRSSANLEDGNQHSFAGIFNSYLSISSLNDMKRAIIGCWQSVWSTRAAKYYEKINISHAQIRMAVLLQEMIQPSAAGVVFTSDPVSLDPSAIVLELLHGLGEGVVGGTQVPSRYRLSRYGEVLEMALTDPNVILSHDELTWIVATVMKVEGQFRMPQEIEWAINKQSYGFILQVRPITTTRRLSG